MLSRLKNAAWTFTIVTGLFLAYNWLAVPWIEPSSGRRHSLLAHLIGAASGSHHRLRAARLEGLFSEGDWELDSPIVLETDRGLLLIGDYQDREDGSLELKPCTMILFASPRENPRPDPADCLVLRSPGGAVVRFDQPLRLARGEFGRVVGGWLVGPVTISSPESRPGANDGLDIRTGSIQITPEQISAPQELTFAYGPNRGRGRDLIISLEPLSATGRKTPPMELSQLRSFELVHLDYLELHLNEPERKPLDSTELPVGEDPSVQAAGVTVLEVTCRGPFRVDMARQVATFQDEVVVLRRGVEGLDDRLTGDLLSLYWGETRREEPRSDADSSLALPAWHLQRIAVQGTPAVLQIPSESISARAVHGEYDVLRGHVRVADPEGAQLRYQENEFESPALEYRPAEDGGLGRLVARGPGRMRGAMPDKPEEVLEAHWQDRLILQPHQGDQAISLISGARVQSPGMGGFAAEQLHLWLREIPADPGADAGDGIRRPAYRPVRMLAQDGVEMASAQLNAAVEKVELWIRYDDGDGPHALPAGPDGRPVPSAAPGLEPGAGGPRSQYDLAGQHLQIQILQQGSEPLIEHVILEGDVRLQELQAGDSDEQPFHITADLVQIEHANRPQARLRLVGQPVEVSGRGVVLEGKNVQLNREHNLAWILGPGRLSLPWDAQALAAHDAPRDDSPADRRQPMTVTWTERLAFDGQSARFLGDVRLQGIHAPQPAERSVLRVSGGALDVQFQPGIDLREPQPGRMEIQSLNFPGSVFLEHTSYVAGTSAAIDRLQVRELTLDRPSGRLHALGPGWGTSTRPGASFSEAGALGRLGAGGDRPDLSYLRVDFEDEIAGNFLDRDLRFRGRVRALYGPVRQLGQELDPDPPGGLDPGVFLLSSQELAVAETPATPREAPAIEVVANGNAMVEGRAFTARGWRISYAHAKQLLILEGDGRNDAELWRKGSVTPDAAAQQIRFWTHDHSIQVDGGRFLDLSTFGARTTP